MVVRCKLKPGENGTRALLKEYGERELREVVKEAGGYWNPDKKAWHLAYRKVIELGLEKRFIDSELCL